MSVRGFDAPAHYLQGPGAIDALGGLAAGLGPSCAVVCDEMVHRLYWPAVSERLAAAGVDARAAIVTAEVSDAAVTRLDQSLGADARDSVIGLGGGRSIDSAKAVAARRRLPVITIPTAASNDSPTSRIFVIYKDDGSLARVERLANNPHAVIVDTEILLRAPARLLRAGIGDALTKKFEAEQCAAVGGITSLGMQPLTLPAIIANHAYDTLRAHALPALADVAVSRLSESFERTIEAVILMSGVGFENGGLSLAHSLTRGLTVARGPARMLHGEQVAFGLLVQLSLTGDADPVLRDLLSFYGRIGLPRSLADIGLSGENDAELAMVAAATFTAPHIRHLVDPIDEAKLRAAFLRVDALARAMGTVS